jgi:hypothetical protein
MIWQRECEVNNSHDLQLANSHYSNSSNNNAYKNNKWGLLHVDGEGRKLAGLMGLVLISMLVITLTLAS